mmetsp:Transcript_15722/g.24147  ORF Transcript_15722/g.24147 Transcript_15722/m.24147 type:complete len:88 (+) Transcript_15722:1349-1612(+)
MEQMIHPQQQLPPHQGGNEFKRNMNNIEKKLNSMVQIMNEFASSFQQAPQSTQGMDSLRAMAASGRNTSLDKGLGAAHSLPAYGNRP